MAHLTCWTYLDLPQVPELVTIINIKIKAKGYKLTSDANANLGGIIDNGTDKTPSQLTHDLHSKLLL